MNYKLKILIPLTIATVILINNLNHKELNTQWTRTTINLILEGIAK